ncbi:putative restriction endonuclease [Micromonospora sp. M71_S20]|uniref:Uma2 family endonuclease n=1 Tax=Micromonospora sp. M71_S20 TaxID=592872 RepID=UPI000EAE86F3|nr:Uma2 family endonuclease [Micromonospora sp. M71_S20]RLK22998.1 putative restriction endonuclease [Micromonospora sp. M71_S20]
MIVAPILPEWSEWTVDDLGDPPKDKAKVYAHAGVRTYWVVDPLHERMTLTEYTLDPTGEYEVLTHTEDLFVTERPWKVSVDLPALTTRRAGLLARDEG